MTFDAFCRKNTCSVNAFHRLETTRHRGLRGLRLVWFSMSLRCSSALKHFAPALYFIPAIVTFSKQKQTPLYKISKKARRHSSARHLMGINYACFFLFVLFFAVQGDTKHYSKSIQPLGLCVGRRVTASSSPPSLIKGLGLNRRAFPATPERVSAFLPSRINRGSPSLAAR